ncbi:MAG: tyrosine-protein phosphatase [Sphingomonadales bacterium]|nr:tyrosine-protein phosphatase [Sphingomonadales bacterium]
MTAPSFDPAGTGLLLALDGCHNFRRVAGWRTRDGRTVRAGRLFRADGLGALSDADHRSLAALGLGHVFDLRASGEIAHAPSRWPGDWQLATWQGAESAAEADITRMMAREGLTAADFRAAMCGVYARFHDDLAAATAAAARALAEGDGSVLIHCTAGKDRTGFVTAMVLNAAGVTEDDVLADYLLSNASLPSARIRFNVDGRLDGVEARAPGALDALVGVHAEYLQAAVAPMIAGFGSVDGWLAARAGIDTPLRERLRKRLLT